MKLSDHAIELGSNSYGVESTCLTKDGAERIRLNVVFAMGATSLQ